MTRARSLGRRLGVVFLSLVSVAGCEAISDQINDTVMGKIELACTPSNIIADASRRLGFRPGGGRDLTDIDNEISIGSVSVGCKSDIDRRSRAGILMTSVTVNFTVARGPANRSRSTNFDYFVSVIDLADKVLYREAFELTVPFAENETRRSVSGETVELEIPIRAGQTGENFRILVGMVLTREQLNMNRRDRRPRL